MTGNHLSLARLRKVALLMHSHVLQFTSKIILDVRSGISDLQLNQGAQPRDCCCIQVCSAVKSEAFENELEQLIESIEKSNNGKMLGTFCANW